MPATIPELCVSALAYCGIELTQNLPCGHIISNSIAITHPPNLGFQQLTMKNIEPNIDNLENSDLKHLYLLFYLIPILGFFPSLWTLYRHNRVASGDVGVASSKETKDKEEVGDTREWEKELHQDCLDVQVLPSPLQNSTHHSNLATRHSLAVSRLSVTLGFSWLLGYLLLNVGAETSELLTLRLLVLNSLLTSGYFLVSIWLMIRLASRSSVRLPGFTTLAERVIGKHLS